jgi:hypothetical protein
MSKIKIEPLEKFDIIEKAKQKFGELNIDGKIYRTKIETLFSDFAVVYIFYYKQTINCVTIARKIPLVIKRERTA